MRRMLMVLFTGVTLSFSTLALAAEPPPDCTEKQKAVDDAKEAAKDKVKEAQTALACCKNPKKKGCTP